MRKEIQTEQESITRLNEKGAKVLQRFIAKLNESMKTARK